jgi:hypothetical protein
MLLCHRAPYRGQSASFTFINKVDPNVSQFLKDSGEILAGMGITTDPIQIATCSPSIRDLSMPSVEMKVTVGGEV